MPIPVPDRVLRVPFHQDTRLPDTDVPLPAELVTTLVDPPLPPVDGGQWPRLATLHGAVADAVAARLAVGTPGGPASSPVTVVSGDCLVALGSLAGAQRAGLDPAVVWFDAHGDLHSMASSTSGYLGGMVLRMAVGGDPELLTGPLGLRPLDERQAVLVDARDLDPGEVDYLAGSAVTVLGVDDVTGAALERLLPDVPLVLHVDLDVVDAAELPGLLFPAPDGPSASAVTAAIGRVLATGRVAVLDLTCPWHPAQDAAQQAARADLVAGLLARAAQP